VLIRRKACGLSYEDGVTIFSGACDVSIFVKIAQSLVLSGPGAVSEFFALLRIDYPTE
jgi:hypothetical protein